MNLTAAFATTRAVWPQMKERGWGRIVNTASTLAFTAETRKSAYVATKHGALGRAARITCNAVCTAWVLTPSFDPVSRRVGKCTPEIIQSFKSWGSPPPDAIAKLTIGRKQRRCLTRAARHHPSLIARIIPRSRGTK
ncbi:hypothetical protein CO676_33990 [Sinorhizobium sp. BJ1]|nr:hypothetical protein CO676_33990 [Sinorhizobium sp. BJ1]